MQICICDVNVRIVIYLAPSGLEMENENKNRNFPYYIEVIFCYLFGQSNNNKQKFHTMAKSNKKHDEVSCGFAGIHTAINKGDKCALVEIAFDNDNGTQKGITLAYKGFAQAYACVINNGTELIPYCLPHTTIAGTFAAKEEFDFGDGFLALSANNSRFDNGKIFRKPTNLATFKFTASANGQLKDYRKDTSKGKMPPHWTQWGVTIVTDDKPRVENDLLIWGELSLNIGEVADKFIKSYEDLIDRLNK